MSRAGDLGVNNPFYAHNRKCLAMCPTLKPSAQLTSRPKAAADYSFLRAHKLEAACSSGGARLFFTHAHNKGARLRPALDWMMHCTHLKSGAPACGQPSTG